MNLSASDIIYDCYCNMNINNLLNYLNILYLDNGALMEVKKKAEMKIGRNLLLICYFISSLLVLRQA